MSVASPSTEAELSDLIAGAAGNVTPLEISGGGTRLGLGRAVQAERTVSLAGLSGITLYEPGALTLVAKAGTPMAEIEATLAAEKQMLAFEPIDHRALLGTTGEPTIGGVAATAAAGPRRLQKGACRDAMIGIRLVDGQGNAISNGGRVMKNVTGYDLVKLMAGSYGTLGVLTEISFKLLPAPEKTLTLVNADLDFANGVKALAAALGSSAEPTGAAFLPGTGAVLRIEGLEKSVDYRTTTLRELLSSFGGWETVEGDASAALWRRIRDVEGFAGSQAPVWRVSVKPSDGPLLLEALKPLAKLSFVADWAGGLLWLSALESSADEEIQRLHGAIQSEVAALGGHAALVRAPVSVRAAVDVFQPEDAVLQRLSAGLRSKFDPHGILNPGRMRA